MSGEDAVGLKISGIRGDLADGFVYHYLDDVWDIMWPRSLHSEIFDANIPWMHYSVVSYDVRMAMGWNDVW